MNTSVPFAGGMVSQDVAPWVERLARVGFAAKGVLYLTVGILAASAALGHGGKADADKHDAMSTLIAAPFGRGLLAVIAVGLVGYSVWRIIQGIFDPERRGTGAKGLALRAGSIGRGIFHLGLAYTAAIFALGRAGGGAGGEPSEESWTARALDTPGGVYVLWGVAAGLMIYGLYELACAVRAKLGQHLDLGRMAHQTRRWVIGVSRFGIAARGVVFGTIGLMLARAARQHDPQQAGGLRDSLRELLAFGRWPFAVIALGLAAYGIYELVNARYRRIRVR